MLATDTQAIADYLKQIIADKNGLDTDKVSAFFADTRDTLCYATNDNQTAVRALLEEDADIAIVIGGRNSSNSLHLVELCEEKLPTYFIQSETDLIDANTIRGFNWRTHEEYIQENFLPQKDTIRILMTSGASCPDAIVEAVISKLSTLIPGAQPLVTN
jgi:4-hydroxy-3-methylbut-2-enyl diphosphate reductase